MAPKSKQSAAAYSSRRNGIATLAQTLDSVSAPDWLGSGSRRSFSMRGARRHYKFFAADQLLPVALKLQISAAIKGGPNAARARLQRPTLLIHAQDAKHAGCWLSCAMDVGNENGNPAFWMLKKTAVDSWSLSLRGAKGEVAAYHLKTKNQHSFSLKLKMSRTHKAFGQWPSTITISE